jgi:hypothetical protein
MTTLKSNILKKITLGLSTIICTCALYSTANASEEATYNYGNALSQEEAYYATPVINIANMPDYNTVEVQESTTKKYLGNRKMIALASTVAVILAVLGGRKAYSKYKNNKEASSVSVPS